MVTTVGSTVSISATTLCEKQGLSGTLLQGCVYDVVVSNDTALAEQETLKIGRLSGTQNARLIYRLCG